MTCIRCTKKKKKNQSFRCGGQLKLQMSGPLLEFDPQLL